MEVVKDFEEHFSRLALKYTKVRTTDIEPVMFIQNILRSVPNITAANLGCGAGRYDYLFLEHFKSRMKLFCVDSNQEMLVNLVKKLSRCRAEGFHPIRTSADRLPIRSRSLDCLFSFNSVHLIPIKDLLREASRVLKRDRYFFIYTRFRSQNERNIWGRWFPMFAEKENRLYELKEIETLLGDYPDLSLGPIQYFQYNRSLTLRQLVEKARNFHYSTFRFYTEEDFERSLQQFRNDISAHFGPGRVNWQDENVLLVIRKQG